MGWKNIHHVRTGLELRPHTKLALAGAYHSFWLASATGNPTTEPMYGQQWDMDMIHVPDAHKVTTGSSNVVVGVLDSGISSTHPDLATQIAKDKSTSCLGGVTDTRYCT